MGCPRPTHTRSAILHFALVFAVLAMFAGTPLHLATEHGASHEDDHQHVSPCGATEHHHHHESDDHDWKGLRVNSIIWAGPTTNCYDFDPQLSTEIVPVISDEAKVSRLHFSKPPGFRAPPPIV